jgi:two-component system cell cycle response regulator
VRVVIESTPFKFEKHVIPTTVSLGFTIWLGGEDSADALFQRADAALYAAKEAGRNRAIQG